MRRHLPRAALLALLLALPVGLGSACGHDIDIPSGPGGTSGPETVEGNGWRGVRLDAHLDWLQLPDGAVLEDDEVSSFTPTADDVRRFESEIPDAEPAVPTSGQDSVDLEDYVRQYTGVEGGGARHLVVAGLCDGAAEDMEWQAGWIEVADGGTCFWDATMDLDSGEILRFSFHGAS